MPEKIIIDNIIFGNNVIYDSNEKTYKITLPKSVQISNVRLLYFKMLNNIRLFEEDQSFVLTLNGIKQIITIECEDIYTFDSLLSILQFKVNQTYGINTFKILYDLNTSEYTIFDYTSAWTLNLFDCSEELAWVLGFNSKTDIVSELTNFSVQSETTPRIYNNLLTIELNDYSSSIITSNDSMLNATFLVYHNTPYMSFIEYEFDGNKINNDLYLTERRMLKYLKIKFNHNNKIIKDYVNFCMVLSI